MVDETAPQPILDVPPKPELTPERLKDAIVATLDADKAEDIVTIPLKDRSSIADYLVIASGLSSRQVGAMADHLIRTLQHDLDYSIAVEGQAQGDWVLMDCGDVIVHLFRPEVRSFYAIERMWGLEPPHAVAEPPGDFGPENEDDF